MVDPCMDPGAGFEAGDNLFHLLAENLHDSAICLLDPRGRVASWNRGAQQMFGWTPAEVQGHSLHTLLRTTFPKPEPEIEADLLRDGSWAGTLTHRHRNGEAVVVAARWALRRDAQSQPSGVLTIYNRSTAAGRTDAPAEPSPESVQQLQRDLERRVEERTLALKIEIVERQRAEKALQEEAQRKDRFLAMLAHELRNPLAPIRTALEILRMPNATQAVLKRAQETMERQVGHLARIVDDLLDVSRIASGRIALRSERLDLGWLVRDSAEDWRAAFAHAGLDLVLSVPQVPVWVHGDPTRLMQVVDNLLDNAKKFTPSGGRVTVSLEQNRPHGQVMLGVSDTGAGIEAELLPRLFEPFCQADTSLERTKGGLGLGLALVKGLAELHGGSVEASSAGVAQGSRFTLRLPAEPEPAAVRAKPDHPAPAGRPLRILVVEDNPDAAEMLRALLLLAGHQVQIAQTGPQGVDAARTCPPEVVLCDIGLPGLDGYGVIRELRREPRTTSAYAIAVTGYGSEEDRRRSRAAGFDQHLVKPVDIDVLEGLLQRVGQTLEQGP